jgi:hypothetical protein
VAVAKKIQFRTAKMLQHSSFGVKASLRSSLFRSPANQGTEVISEIPLRQYSLKFGLNDASRNAEQVNVLWHAFRVAPSAALAVLICLITIFWCFWLLRRTVYYTLDRFFLGFIGLLSIYQGLRVLKEIGLMTVFSSRILSNFVELAVALLYLLAASIMRLSSEQRRYSDFQFRAAKAEPKQPLKVACPPLPKQYATPIEQLAPVLSDPAFKLYFYLCTRSEATTGWVTVDDSALHALRKDFGEVASLLKELEQHGMCQLSDVELAGPITVQLLSPRQEASPASSATTTDSLLALDREVRAASAQAGAGTQAKVSVQHELWPL